MLTFQQAAPARGTSTISIIDRQSELPRCIPLFRYIPNRVRSLLRDLDPGTVRSSVRHTGKTR